MTYRHKRSFSTFPILLLAMLVVGAGIWYVYFSGGKAAGQAQQGTPEVKVAYPLKETLVEWDEYTGRFQPVERVEIRSRVSGYLESVKFIDGQIVKKGDVLFVIDTRPFEIQVKRSKAKLDLAEKQLERGKMLVTKSAVARDEVDKRVQEYEEARSAYADAKLNLEFAEVKAPVTGRVSRHLVSVGNLVTGGDNNATLLTTVVSLDPIHFYFDASESDLLKYIRLDQAGKRETSRKTPNPVYVRLMDEQKFTRLGHMDFVDNELDKSTGTIQGRAVFPNPDMTLTPGMFARARLLGSGEYEAILVPDDCVGTDQTRKFVYVVNDKDSVEKRVVTLGPIHRGLRIVRDGLTTDDRVVIGTLMKIRPGMTIKPVDALVTMTQEPDMPPYHPDSKQLSTSKKPKDTEPIDNSTAADTKPAQE